MDSLPFDIAQFIAGIQFTAVADPVADDQPERLAHPLFEDSRTDGSMAFAGQAVGAVRRTAWDKWEGSGSQTVIE